MQWTINSWSVVLFMVLKSMWQFLVHMELSKVEMLSCVQYVMDMK